MAISQSGKDLQKHTTILYFHHIPQRKSYHRNRRHLRKVNEEWTPLEQTKENEHSEENEIYDIPPNDSTINKSPPDSSQPATTTVTILRQSQHTIRKPKWYSDSQHDNHTNW